jgi:hypothetical protein
MLAVHNRTCIRLVGRAFVPAAVFQTALLTALEKPAEKRLPARMPALQKR